MLAVVIPAYKGTFLRKSLQSLAFQTRKDFKVYIGDDNSPDDLESICSEYKTKLNIHFTKFEFNIGAKKLVTQWKRCISLSKDEEWLWLFSDDDIADENCVEVFYKTIEQDKSGYDVYRFNTNIINDKDVVISVTPESPFIDTSENMALEILLGKRGNSMPDHIFSRHIYNKCGGFVETDFAQAADWATSILFSKEKGICTMQNAKVNWRMGNYNISGNASKNRSEKLIGYLQFLQWVLNHFMYLESQENSEYQKIKRATVFSLLSVIKHHYKGLDFRSFFNIYRFFLNIHNPILAIISTIRLFWLAKI